MMSKVIEDTLMDMLNYWEFVVRKTILRVDDPIIIQMYLYWLLW